MFMFRGFLALAVAVVLIQSASAADENQKPIVVTATRSEEPLIPIPVGIRVVNRQEIEASGARTLSELLRARAGVHVSDLYGDGSSATIDMRGFGATAVSNTLILLDGRPLNNASDIGTIDLSLVDLANVERVEIVQGSAGTLYGNQAVGGLINIVTRGTSGRINNRVQATVASYQDQGLSAQMGARLENGFAFSIRGRTQSRENYREHNHARLNQADVRLEQNTSSGLFFLEHTQSEENLDLPGALFRDELEADRRQSASIYARDFSATDTQNTRLGVIHELTSRWRFEGEATRRDSDREFITSFRFSSGTLSTQQRRITTLNPRLLGSLPCGTSDCRLTLGMDFEQTTYRLLTSFGPQNVDQDIHSGYAQIVIPFDRTVLITLGARIADVANAIESGGATQLDDRLSVGSAGISWQANSEWRLFARLDQNFRFAKVDEHTNPVFGQPVGLANQTGLSKELGLESKHGVRLLKAILYELSLDNEIAFDATGFSNVNLPQTRRRGLTLEGSWPIENSWTLHGDATWVDGVITAGANEGKRIPLVPRLQVRMAADWNVNQNWMMRLEQQWVGSQPNGSDFANTFPLLPAYSVTNMHWRYQRKGLELGFQVQNLFNRRYSETGAIGYDATFTSRDAFFPAPERNLRITLGHTL